MKSYMSMILMIGAIAMAEDTREHTVPAGPKGGKMLESEPQHAEFWVNPDGKVELTFYGEHLEPAAPAGQAVRVTAQAHGGNAALTMEKGEQSFISAESLPEGEGYIIVVQIKSDANAPFQNFRIPYHTQICGGCDRAEYACTCGH